MNIDESSTVPHDESEGQSYRMVNRRYYCHLCGKEFNEMVNALENIKCSQCLEEFVEIIEKKPKMGVNAESNELDEEKRRANEQYRIVFGTQGGTAVDGATVIHNPTINRTDLYDRSTNNLYGVPNPQRLR